ncbi:MAG: twin-arginine translocase subunit TatC [Candidatus Hydrothermarchaeaceae archaeon]
MHEVKWADLLYNAKKRFIFFVAFVFAGFTLFWFLADGIIGNIKSHLLPEAAEMIVTSPMEYVLVKLEISLLFSVFVALPIFGVLVLRRLKIRFNLVSAVVWLSLAALLFLFGFFFTYLLLLPITIKVLTGLATDVEILPYYSINQFVLFVVLTTLVFSLVFDLPVVISWLAIRGYVAVESLKRWRKGVYVTIFIVAAIITADPTPLTQILLSIPLIILYEASIISAKIFGKKNVSA